MKRYINVAMAAIKTTKMLAFSVTPLAVSGNMVIGTIGALDDWRL